MKKRVIAIAAATSLMLSGCGSVAQNSKEWPSKKIDIQVAYTAGGTADTVNRQLAVLMGEELGVNFQVTNVVGGSGSIAGQQVSTAARDGYTWLGDVAHTVSGWRTLDYVDMGWEEFYGFYAATSPYVLFVSGSSPYRSAEELFAAMEADPTLKWGNAGLGSINQLTGQLMLDIVGLEGNTVPYDGGRAAAIKVVAGEVTWSWCGLSDIIDLAESGDIRILGICDEKELEITGVKESYTVPSLLDTYPELSPLQGLLYWGFRIPRDTPEDTVVKIQNAFEAAVSSEEWTDFCRSKGLETACTVGTESDEMCARLESIYAWGLYDTGISTISPEEFDIPRIEDYAFPANDRITAAPSWPE